MINIFRQEEIGFILLMLTIDFGCVFGLAYELELKDKFKLSFGLAIFVIGLCVAVKLMWGE